MAAENSRMQRAHSIWEFIRRVNTETIQINMHKTANSWMRGVLTAPAERMAHCFGVEAPIRNPSKNGGQTGAVGKSRALYCQGQRCTGAYDARKARNDSWSYLTTQTSQN